MTKEDEKQAVASSHNNAKKWYEKRKNVIAGIAVIFAVWLISAIFIYYYQSGVSTSATNDVWARRGQVGDMFGAVNALFSGLAFAGVIYAILLQKDQLILTKKELNIIKEDFELTKDEFKKQNETFSAQRFDNTFFQLLNLHNQIVNDLEIDGAKGRDCFEKVREQIKIIHHYRNPHKDLCEPLNTSSIEDAWEKSRNYSSKLDHYFKNIYHTYKFIKESELGDEEQQRYAMMVSAQLSAKELYVLFINSFLYPKARKLYLHFGVFEQLDKDLPSSSVLSAFSEAYGTNFLTANPEMRGKPHQKLRKDLVRELKLQFEKAFQHSEYKYDIGTIYQNYFYPHYYEAVYTIEATDSLKKADKKIIEPNGKNAPYLLRFQYDKMGRKIWEDTVSILTQNAKAPD